MLRQLRNNANLACHGLCWLAVCLASAEVGGGGGRKLVLFAHMKSTGV